MKKISVIIPVYKVEDYLERCVSSVCRQTYTDLEIILVDDGSPDNSGKLCDELAAQDGRIRVIHKENGGLSDARNAGMEAATGDYIAFVDSDDWYDPGMLEILSRLCEENDAEIAECSYRNIYENYVRAETGLSGAVMEMTPAQAIESNLDWKYTKPVAWNKLYRRDIVGDIRYPVGRLHEDEFTTHLFYLAAKKIMYVDVALVNYERRNAGSITASFRPQNMDACDAFRAKAHRVLKEPQLEKIHAKMCDNYCYVVLDKVEKCEKAYPDCEQLKNTVRNIYADFDMLKKYGVNCGYIERLDALFEKYEDILKDRAVL
jgi:glycosyltransferase involved in cell wall biosynthesis